MADCCQVIAGDGSFQESNLSRFVGEHGVANARTNYQVVAIMGPQSSGKSTLMNHVFGTSFQEMDAMTGRHQTTKGVWLSKSPKISDTCTLIMDLEGSDGRERGEDDTNFERQSALFALAVADVLLINVWCHDIGREQGSGKPLMKTVFQVNLKLFAPEPNRRKTVLLFVIRDKSKTPLPKLIEVLSDDVHKMWDSISKPPQYVDSRMDDFFEVKYTALPHYEDKYEDFIADTVVLRRRFTQEGDDSLLRTGDDKLPADSLVLSTQQIWEVIKSQKDLNLPAHKVMVANIRCNEIKMEQLRNLTADQAWQSIAQESNSKLVRDFGKLTAGLVDSCLRGYGVEAMYFDSSVRAEHHADLAAKLTATVSGPFKTQLNLLVAELMGEFDKNFRLAILDNASGAFAAIAARMSANTLATFDERAQEFLVAGTNLTADEARDKLAAELHESIERSKHQASKQALHAIEGTLTKLIAVPAVELLQTFPPNLWSQLEHVQKQAVATSTRDLRQQLDGYALTSEEQASLATRLTAAADKKLNDLLQEAALTRVVKMRDVFNNSFQLDEHGTPRTWRPQDNIPQLARQARREAARVLALLAVRRSPNFTSGDTVELAILNMVKKDIDDAAVPGSSTPAGGDGSSQGSFELATATHWPDVQQDNVLIAPHEARLAWREFISTSALSVQQAQVTQQANLMAGKRSAPIWALFAILFLGWNEFMVVLWNPLYLMIGAVLFIVGRQMYGELDVDAELQRGPVMGLINIYHKLGGVLHRVAVQNVEVVRHLGGAVVDLVHNPQHNDASHQSASNSSSNPTPLQDGGVVHHQQRVQHHSAVGLKQRGAGSVQDGVQMTPLKGNNSSVLEDEEDA